MKQKIALTYDDIQLIPSLSIIKSRKDISLRTLVSRNYGLLNPFVASPMDTVCEYEMALKLAKMGSVGCIHRFMSIDEQTEQISKLKSAIYEGVFHHKDGTPYQIFEEWGIMYDDWHAKIVQIPIMASVGANGDYLERAKSLIDVGANIILIDVAHGHHINVKNAITEIKKIKWTVDVIAGNIATVEAAFDLIEWGADGLRVGIGGGSLCETRTRTGFGIPNVTCLEEICKVATVPVMADGGIRTSGDVAKALALGSSSVMLGSMLAGTEESPGKVIETSNGLFKRYRGSASLETKTVHGMSERNVEGESTIIPFKGGVRFVIEGIIDGVKSALSYAGASDLSAFHPDWIQVTNAGIVEARPHLVR